MWEYLFTWSDCRSHDNKASGNVYTAANRQMQRETFIVQSTGWRNCIMLNSWMCGNIQTFDSTVPFFFFFNGFVFRAGAFSIQGSWFLSTPSFFPYFLFKPWWDYLAFHLPPSLFEISILKELSTASLKQKLNRPSKSKDLSFFRIFSKATSHRF